MPIASALILCTRPKRFLGYGIYHRICFNRVVEPTVLSSGYKKLGFVSLFNKTRFLDMPCIVNGNISVSKRVSVNVPKRLLFNAPDLI